MIWHDFFFIMLWLGFIAYAFILAPPDQPETFDLIRRMSMGDWEGINPSIIAIFQCHGHLADGICLCRFN